MRDTPLGSDWADAHPTDVDALLATLTAHGVHGAVLAQAVNVYGFDNSYVAAARSTAPDRLVGLSVIDMAAPDRVDRLAYWSTERGLGGTRLFNIPPSDPPWLGTGASAEVLGQAVATGVRVVAACSRPTSRRSTSCSIRRGSGRSRSTTAASPPSATRRRRAGRR